MKLTEPLAASALFTACDPQSFDFETTAELMGLDGIPGHERALEALHLGVSIRRDGYNVYALGSEGLGRHWTIQRILEARAAAEPVPPDWCYVHNFKQPHRPRALRLPPGRGAAFRDELDSFVDRLRALLPAAFEDEEYRHRLVSLETEHEARREAAFAQFKRHAEVHDVTLVRTPAGLALTPIRNGQVLDPEEFHRLPPEEQTRIRGAMERLGEELRKIVEALPSWEHDHHERVAELNRSIAQITVGHLAAELRARWADMPSVLEHLELVQKDIVQNVHELVGAREGGMEGQLPAVLRRLIAVAQPFERYHANLLVDHAGAKGAPVIFEDRPTHGRLIGRIEHRPQLGALITDFSLIKAGALHRANGGYLVIDARKLLTQPFAYDELKRALISNEIRIESLAESLSLVSTVSLEPESVPLEVKVVLIGERPIYYLLAELDPEFLELFKIAADFSDEVDRNAQSQQSFAQVLASIGRKEALRPLDREAIARVIEHGARLAGDAEKLSTRIRSLADLMRESDHYTRAGGRAVTTVADVQQALDAQVRRADRMRQRIHEAIRRGTLLIDTHAEAVGQINGLTVVKLGDFSFSYPVRITSRVRLGKGEVVDIERETELGGPLHSKGVMILSGFLGARYAHHRPLALSASLVFEQSYGPVEGDSASAAELIALLSALAEVPLKQSLAITGSVNQHGQIQPIGGVNEKIEGFFDTCQQRGFSGEEGVIIPEANVKHLMLRQDIVQAAQKGSFRIFPIQTIDQGLELLTGQPAGAQVAGVFATGSINQRVEAKLHDFAEHARAFAHGQRPGGGQPG